MTRFFISLNDVDFVYNSINLMGGEIFIPKINSILITDIKSSKFKLQKLE